MIGFLKQIGKQVGLFGFDLRLFVQIIHLPKYITDLICWILKGGVVHKVLIVLNDFNEKAGTASGHYFHQDLLVAQFIHDHKPKRHIDVGSRIDGFVSNVAAFREIEVFDIRDLPPSVHKNIVFRQADLMKTPDLSGTIDSVSSLHAVEHFGLGRYNDPLSVDGHLAGIQQLCDMVKQGGRLYISFPIGEKNEVHFNAHRVFNPRMILNLDVIKQNFTLIRFDYVDDKGDLQLKMDPLSSDLKVKYGCGIYSFRKIDATSRRKNAKGEV